jgi:hypothetical protein
MMTLSLSDKYFNKEAQEYAFLLVSLRLMLDASNLTVEAYKEVVLKHLEASVNTDLLTQEFANDVRNKI